LTENRLDTYIDSVIEGKSDPYRVTSEIIKSLNQDKS
jgi:hypothetical protein